MGSPNERRRYYVTPTPIGCVHAPASCIMTHYKGRNILQYVVCNLAWSNNNLNYSMWNNLCRKNISKFAITTVPAGGLATLDPTVYPKKYAHGFVVLCFVVVMESFIMNSHEVFIHIHQGCFAGTGAIVRLPQCQWSKPDGYGKISQCITTTKHSKAKTVWIFIGIYCRTLPYT